MPIDSNNYIALSRLPQLRNVHTQSSFLIYTIHDSNIYGVRAIVAEKRIIRLDNSYMYAHRTTFDFYIRAFLFVSRMCKAQGHTCSPFADSSHVFMNFTRAQHNSNCKTKKNVLIKLEILGEV